MKSVTPINPDASLGFLINRTAYVLRVRFRAILRRHGHAVTPEECAVLLRLWQRDGQSQGVLAGSTIRERTTITRILDGLVDKGFVQRKPDLKDRRVVCAWLTPKGRQLHDHVAPLAQGLLGDAARHVSREDLECTLRTLKQVQANLLQRTPPA